MHVHSSTNHTLIPAQSKEESEDKRRSQFRKVRTEHAVTDYNIHIFSLCSLLRLSMDQKCNIATRELDELREEIQREQEEGQMCEDNLRVSCLGSFNRILNMAYCGS